VSGGEELGNFRPLPYLGPINLAHVTAKHSRLDSKFFHFPQFTKNSVEDPCVNVLRICDLDHTDKMSRPNAGP
jgi:hypothetical protein